MSSQYYLDHVKLRSVAALLAAVSGVFQCATLWLLPLTPNLLLTAWCGSVFLVLSLGLFGISRFSLFAAVALPLLRSWLGLAPLPIEVWEWLRIAVDVLIAALAAPVFWISLDPDFRSIAPGRKNFRAKQATGPGDA